MAVYPDKSLNNTVAWRLSPVGAEVSGDGGLLGRHRLGGVVAAFVAELHTRWQADPALRTGEFQRRPALKAELRLRRIFVLALRAFHGFPIG